MSGRFDSHRVLPGTEKKERSLGDALGSLFEFDQPELFPQLTFGLVQEPGTAVTQLKLKVALLGWCWLDLADLEKGQQRVVFLSLQDRDSNRPESLNQGRVSAGIDRLRAKLVDSPTVAETGKDRSGAQVWACSR